MIEFLKFLLTLVFGQRKVFEVEKEHFNEVFSHHLEEAMKNADGTRYIIKTPDKKRKVSFRITKSR